MSEISSDVFDLYHECYGKPLFLSLWTQAWREDYPTEIQPLSSATRTLLGQLLEELRCDPNARLLDLGCGSGGVGSWLARELGARLVGVDFSPRAVELARNRVGEFLPAERSDFRIGDFVDTGLDDESVDLVVSIDALIMAPDVNASLKEVWRVLVAGGTLVFTTRDAERDSPRWEVVGPQWRSALERNGFSVDRVTPRPELSVLWGRLFSLWIEHEEQLRRELPAATVDLLIEEAKGGKSRLGEDRAWLPVSATRSSH